MAAYDENFSGFQEKGLINPEEKKKDIIPKATPEEELELAKRAKHAAWIKKNYPTYENPGSTAYL